MDCATTRRSFIFGTLAVLTVKSNSLANILKSANWYKGNIHMHSFWSDGRAFPEEAISIYKRAGYNFLGLSDHNIFPKEHVWKKVSKKYAAAVKRYKAAFPDAQTRTLADGTEEVRCKPYGELCSQFNEDGKFRLIPAVEATMHTKLESGRIHHVHMNYLNIPETIPCVKKFGRREMPFRKKQPVDIVGMIEKEVCGQDSISVLNHPIWRWYDISPEVLVESDNVKFFEVCNNGSHYRPAEELPADGLDCDRFWDVVNAFRARRGKPLLFAVGTDDTHYYFNLPGERQQLFDSWIKVRSESLDASSIVRAMKAGDYMACAGMEFENISFDSVTRTLSVTVKASPEKARMVKFIVSKRDFGEKPVKTLTIRPKKAAKTTEYERTVNIYDDKIGCVVKEFTCPKGETATFSYSMAADDLYVRARAEEDSLPVCKLSLHPKKITAWTQPYGA